jgi:hypothetical protein
MDKQSELIKQLQSQLKQLQKQVSQSQRKKTSTSLQTCEFVILFILYSYSTVVLSLSSN